MDIPNTSISPEEAQASSVDERIQRLALELKKEQNSCARISSLPDELLLEVFMILKSIPPVYGWHRVNLVCCHWRSLAVAAPVLWTNPPTYNHDLTLLMLERSKMADLDIYMHYQTSMDTVAAVLCHAAHIRSLKISDGKIYKKTEDALLALDHPKLPLEKLEITCYWYDQNFQILSVNTRPFLGQLRYLHLSGLVYDWRIFPLPNIEHLILTPDSEVVAPISAQKLVETLAQMQKLIKLEISLPATLHQNNAAIDDAKIADLPLLSYLSVNFGGPHELSYFLSHLSLPRLSCLYIRWDQTEPESNANYSRTIEAIVSLIKQGTFGTELQSLDLRNGYLDLSLICRRKRVNFSPKVHVVLSSNNWANEPTRLMAEARLGIIKMIQSKLSSLVDAAIDSLSITQPILLLLGQLPSLESITLYNGQVALLTSALTIPSDLLPNSHPPFPKLQSITFIFLTGSSDELLQFRKCLMVRRDCGFLVEELEFYECLSLPQDEVTLFKNVVGNVTNV